MMVLKKDNPLVVLDVGASNGIHKRWKKLGEPYTAILVEPDPREYANLAKSLPSNYILLNTALFDSIGKINLNLCKKQMCSSVLQSNFEFLKRYPEYDRFSIVDTVEVDVTTLDTAIAGKVNHIDFIKIDAEAAELFILKGAKKVLDDVIGLEVESAFSPMRSNQPLFCDVHQFMIEQGFELVDIRADYWRRDVDSKYKSTRKGQIIWADGLFFRSPEYFFSNNQKPSIKKLERIFITYLAYGYHDLAVVLLNYALENDVINETQEKKMLKKLLRRHRKMKIPDFRGKNHISLAIRGVANIFSPGCWFTGGDHRLGNKY